LRLCDDGWKRWRFNSDLNTVFWWEAPTLAERDAVGAEVGWRPKHVYVELHSSPASDREMAKRYMPTDSLDDMEQSDDPLRSRAAGDLMDVTHYPDRHSDYVQRWLDTIGD